jgi:hypothetical protein
MRAWLACDHPARLPYCLRRLQLRLERELVSSVTSRDPHSSGPTRTN